MSKECGEGSSEDRIGDTQDLAVFEKTDAEIVSKLKKVKEGIAECKKNQIKMEQQIADWEKQQKQLYDRETAEYRIFSLVRAHRKCVKDRNAAEENYTNCNNDKEMLKWKRSKKCPPKHDNLVVWKKKLEEATVERDQCSKDSKEVIEWVKHHEAVKVIFELLRRQENNC
ncbi:unnamed protein product [Gongylonema pulchrum]|uniref:Clathrin light chain n=1 Tax=Gongylonema pulchrum TaxID=637853 RepID=A0A183D7X3_9BILA|nr:unnamed protein product [Gongylonema pulchrum]